MTVRVALASAVAIWLAASSAWGHTFPPVHTVVVQVERCELVLLVGYTAGTGEPTERVVARAASQPKSHIVDALRETLAAYALAPLTITVGGRKLAPTSIRAKIGLDPGGTRPIVVVLVAFSLPADGERGERGEIGDAFAGGAQRLVIASNDPRTTRISWVDRASGRVDLDAAPTQGHWYSGVASFLLPLGSATGGSTCTVSRSVNSSAADSTASPSSRSSPSR